MKKFTLILAALLCGLSLFASDRKKQAQLQSLCSSNALQGSAVSICIRKIDGSPVASVNESMRLVPASNVKLITTAAALASLGGDFCFETGLAYGGEIRDSILYGNLVVLNGLDPTLCGENCDTSAFKEWQMKIKNCGIKAVQGSFYASDGILAQETIWGGHHHPSWQIEDIDSSDAPDLGMGTFAELFGAFLRRSGILTDKNIMPTPRDSLILLFNHLSPPLKELARHCNTESDNRYAETFARAIGLKMYQDCCYESSNKARQKVLQQIYSCPQRRYCLVDGSGLSRKNLVSSAYFVDFLTAMSKNREFDNFLSSLPAPGEGTLKNILANSGPGLRKHIRMKSGTMDGIRCYSGYLLDAKGNPETVFSILTNCSTAPRNEVTAVIEKILLLIGE